ncbi:MAG: membrane protein insertase YidC [Burkholderiaceae bacterium]
MQTQRTILWVIFVMSLVFLWDAWQRDHGRPSLFGGPTPQQTRPAGSDPKGSTTPGATSSGPQTDATVPAAPAGTPATAVGSPTGPATGVAPTGAGTSPGGQALTFGNDVLTLTISTVGATLQRAELLKHRDEGNVHNLVLLDSEPGRFYQGQSGVVGVDGAPNHTMPWTVAEGPTAATAREPARLVLTATGGGIKVERRYLLQPGSYELKVEDRVTNVSDRPLAPTVYRQLTRDGNPPPGGSAMYSTYSGPVIYTDEAKFQKVDFPSIEKGKASHIKQANDGWLGIIQHYFAVAWIPQQQQPREYYTRRIDNNLYSVGVLQGVGQIAPGQTADSRSTLYIGPQDQQVLGNVAPGLDLVVDYGWLTAIAKPLFWLLDLLHNWVRNWGWAIVLLTILVKLAFFPLQAASYRSMAKMRKVTPKMTAIRERYGNDRMKMNQAMMELYKTEKINPLGGCLPVVVQIPVFIALYWVLLASVEMRNAPWIGWIRDLAAPDPFFILPVLMAVTMFIQTKLNPTPPDPVQAKLMMWMPLIFSVMFFFFPAGLVLYWLVSNLFSIVQQWVITRRIEGKPIFGRAPAG